MSELKPCPFCGGEAQASTYQIDSIFFHRPKQYLCIKCKHCKATSESFSESPFYSALGKATEAWNKRVGEQDEYE